MRKRCEIGEGRSGELGIFYVREVASVIRLQELS